MMALKDFIEEQMLEQKQKKFISVNDENIGTRISVLLSEYLPSGNSF